MKIKDGKVTLTDAHEKELYEDLTNFIIKDYKGKRDLKRLVNNIDWYIQNKGGDFFQGYVFNLQGTLSCWGIREEGGQDPEKYGLYTDFMQNHCDKFMESHKVCEGSIVTLALLNTYRTLVGLMKERELVVLS